MGPLLLLVSALIAATHAQGWLGGGWGIGLSNWVSLDAVMGHVSKQNTVTKYCQVSRRVETR